MSTDWNSGIHAVTFSSFEIQASATLTLPDKVSPLQTAFLLFRHVDVFVLTVSIIVHMI